MCWNQYVSINTFIFGIFGLLLIAFNNNYSNYKLELFDNSYAYLFMLSFIFMQLIEFILWRNLNNYTVNRIASTFGLLLLSIQPIASLLLVKNINLRNNLILMYSVPTLCFFMYQVLTTKSHTSLSNSGHLKWKWASYPNGSIEIFVKAFYLFFLSYSLVYNKYYSLLLLLLSYFIFIYYFGKDGSAESIWCLSVNSIILYFLVKILLVMPYNEIVNNKKS